MKSGAIAGFSKRNQIAAQTRQSSGDLELARRGVAAQIGARDRGGQQQARLLQFGLLRRRLADRRVEQSPVLLPEIQLPGQRKRIDEGHGLLQSALRRIVGGHDAMQRIAGLPHAEGRLDLRQKPRAGDLYDGVRAAQSVFRFLEALIVAQRLVDDAVKLCAAEGAPPFLAGPGRFASGGFQPGSGQRALHGRRAEKLGALYRRRGRAAGEKKRDRGSAAQPSPPCPEPNHADAPGGDALAARAQAAGGKAHDGVRAL